MTKTNKTTQIDAVKRISTLKKNGVTLTNAKVMVANEFNVSVYKVTQWLTTHNNTVSHNTVVSPRSTTHTSKYSFNDMSTDVRGVLRSIVDQDGKYTIREANAVGKLYSAELSKAKVLIDIHKLNIKANDKEVLRLN